MKAKVILPVAEAAAFKWEGKNACQVIVEANGTKYELFAIEGAPAWALKEGEEVEVEIKGPAAEGRLAKVKLATARPPFAGGGGYNRPPAKTYTAKEVGETANKAARMSVYVFCTIKEELQKKGVTDASAEDVRTMTNTVVMKLIERLP
jgi:hypothetical protein